MFLSFFFFFFQAEDGIRDGHVTGVQTCALPIYLIPRLLDAAPQGLWSLSDGHENLTVENALWNIIERRDVSPAEIVRHARTGSEVVYRSVFACDPRSLARHQNRVCLRWPTFVRQALLNGSHGTPKQTQSIPPDDPETRVQPRLPGNL